jgi:hypothetical protein
MPSHTFTRVGDWQASIDTNRASAEAARKAGQPADILHASDYLIYGYLQTGRDQAAQQLVRSSADVFRAFDPQKATGAAPASAAYYANAAIPARFALERHAWAEAARLEPLASPFANADAVTYFARGLGAAYIKDGTAVRSALAALGQLSGTLAKTNDRYWVGQINIAKREIAGQLAFAEGNATAAFADLRAAATLEEATQLASVTPGPLVPARELLGELLITMNRSGEALAAFRASLKANPNRLWSLCGAARAAALAGDRVAAQSYARQTLQITAQADGPRRPELAEMERLADEGRRATLTPEH